VLYLVIRNPDANRTNVTGRTTGGKAALNHGGRTSGSVGQAAGHRWAWPSRRAPMSTACRVGDLSMRVTMIGWW